MSLEETYWISVNSQPNSSRSILEQRRFATHGYDSQAARAALIQATPNMGRNPLESWELDIAEATVTGLDTLVVGKQTGRLLATVLMPLSCLPNRKIMYCVISDCDVDDSLVEVCRKRSGLEACIVTMAMEDSVVRERILSPNHQVIFTSVEMLLEQDSTTSLAAPEFRCSLLSIVIEKANALDDWSEIDEIRSFIGKKAVPMTILCASMTPNYLSKRFADAQFQPGRLYIVNLGNNNERCTHHVHHLTPESRVLESLVESSGDCFHPTLMWASTDEEAEALCASLRWLVPPALQARIVYTDSRRDQNFSSQALLNFGSGVSQILITTWDLPSGTIPLNRVLHFGVPDSLEDYIDRISRTDRLCERPWDSIVLVDVNDREDIAETALLQYISTDRCRRDVLDSYLGNPLPRQMVLSVPCCDNCIARSGHY